MLLGVSYTDVYYNSIYIPQSDTKYATYQNNHLKKLTHPIYPPCYLCYQSHLSSSVFSFLCVSLFYFSETLQIGKCD